MARKSLILRVQKTKTGQSTVADKYFGVFKGAKCPETWTNFD
ncbi:MAG TPA: hypothetical protein VJY36_04270 [Candidatus Bathyarchaeia archaeon]|jgi:hypothetical protein|nr:hypothetical protein [Candidatus Bathyarchaeia archaeon]